MGFLLGERLKKLTEKIQLFSFFAKAPTQGVPGWNKTYVMTASDDRLKEKIHQETGCFEADVVLIKPDEWDAPSFASLDDRELTRNFPEVMIKVTLYLKKAGIKNIDQDKLVREGSVMPNPVSGRIVFTYKVI